MTPNLLNLYNCRSAQKKRETLCVYEGENSLDSLLDSFKSNRELKTLAI